MLTLSPPETQKLLDLLLDLTAIADSLDQLAKLARIVDLLYPPESSEHSIMTVGLLRTHRHLTVPPRGPHDGYVNHNAPKVGAICKLDASWGVCDRSCSWSCHGPAGDAGEVGND